MLIIQRRTIFERDVKRCQKRNLDLSKLKEVMRLLAEEQVLSAKYRDHTLTGNYVGRRECHIQPDWLLIYKQEDGVIVFERTGTHSDLFK